MCICFSHVDLYIHFSLLQIVIKPDSLLLKARGSQASSEVQNQTSALPSFLELDPVDIQSVYTI